MTYLTKNIEGVCEYHGDLVFAEHFLVRDDDRVMERRASAVKLRRRVNIVLRRPAHLPEDAIRTEGDIRLNLALVIENNEGLGETKESDSRGKRLMFNYQNSRCVLLRTFSRSFAKMACSCTSSCGGMVCRVCSAPVLFAFLIRSIESEKTRWMSAALLH